MPVRKNQKEKTVRVLVAEDDPYARDLMVMMLTRDWRIRVTAEVESEEAVKAILQDFTKRVDVILLDTELPHQEEWNMPVMMNRQEKTPPVLFTGTRFNSQILAYAIQPPCCGYILKQEVQYGLAEAVWRAAQEQWIMTPTIRREARAARLTLPARSVVVDGAVLAARFSLREREIARLSLLFGMSRREIADELQYQNPGEVGNLVSRIYRKLDLPQLIDGEVNPELYFQEGKILEQFKKAQEQAKNGRAVRDRATLAYHLITLPNFEEIF